VLPDGQIEGSRHTHDRATFTAAIIGGTSAYNGATGHVDNTRSPDGIVDRTIHLLARRSADN
jgi:hypothetical protein